MAAHEAVFLNVVSRAALYRQGLPPVVFQNLRHLRGKLTYPLIATILDGTANGVAVLGLPTEPPMLPAVQPGPPAVGAGAASFIGFTEAIAGIVGAVRCVG